MNIKEKATEVKDWVIKHRRKIIFFMLLGGAGVYGYKKLPYHIEIKGLLKPKAANGWKVWRNDDCTKAAIALTEHDKFIGKFIVKGREVIFDSMDKEDALKLANALYDSVGEKFEKVKITEF